VIRILQYWIGHSPTFTKAFRIAARSRHKKPKYVVTSKTRQGGFHGSKLRAQFFYLFLVLVCTLRVFIFPIDADLAPIVVNMLFMYYFGFMMSAICIAAFHDVEFRFGLPSIPFISRLKIRRMRKPAKAKFKMGVPITSSVGRFNAVARVLTSFIK